MAGPRGYSSYHGRGPWWKTLLAVVLLVIILAAAGFMLLQENIVYDETGRPYLEMPWEKEPPSPEAPGEVDITIEAPEESARVTTARLLSFQPLTQADWDAAQLQLGAETERPCNAVAVTVKDSTGLLRFDAATPEGQPFVRTAWDTDAALASVTGDESRTAIALFSCFLDPKAANANVEDMGLKNTGGYIFYDGNNQQWLDPGKIAARAYLCHLAAELAQLGFDEIVLTDVRYPSVGKLDKIYYGETIKAQNIMVFLEEMRAALAPYGTTLSIELPETVISQGSDNIAGLMLADIAPRVDRIYAAAEAGQLDTLSAAVTAASAETVFVPELTAPVASWDGSCLLLPSA